MTKDQIARRLVDITMELQGLYTERAEVDKAERVAFDHAYFECQETSLEARKRQGYRNSLNLTQDRITVEGRILCLHEERDNLRFCVKYGMEAHT